MAVFFETTIKNFSGLSSETKPTIAAGNDVPNGSRWREVDTEKLFFFNLPDDTWYTDSSRSVIYDPINDLQLELDQKSSGPSFPVHLKMNTHTAFDDRLCHAVTGPYIVASDISPGDYNIVLVDATSLNINDIVLMVQNSTNPVSYSGQILGIASNTLTMDTPIDHSFLASLTPLLFEVLCNANVDGSTTPQIFSIVNGAAKIAIHITRVLLHITDNAAMDDSKFGGIVALAKGVVLRKLNSDGSYDNYWNRAIKSNGDFGLIAYDTAYDPKAPAGLFGFKMRYTFAGQGKHGVTVELLEDEQLQFIVQDDLTDLTTLQIMAEGHLINI